MAEKIKDLRNLSPAQNPRHPHKRGYLTDDAHTHTHRSPSAFATSSKQALSCSHSSYKHTLSRPHTLSLYFLISLSEYLHRTTPPLSNNFLHLSVSPSSHPPSFSISPQVKHASRSLLRNPNLVLETWFGWVPPCDRSTSSTVRCYFI